MSKWPAWFWRFRCLVVVALVVSLAVPVMVRGQAPVIGTLLCCLLIKGPMYANELIMKAVGKQMGRIKEQQQRLQQFEDKIWPTVSKLKSHLVTINQEARQLRSLVDQPVGSALQLKSTAFETALLSKAVPADFDRLFDDLLGPVPLPEVTVGAVSSAWLRRIDMANASSKTLAKDSIRSNQVVEKQLDAADSMDTQLEAMSSGVCPMLEASAASWLIRSQVYLQQSLEELLRLQASEAAAEVSTYKESFAQAELLHRRVRGLLGSGTHNSD